LSEQFDQFVPDAQVALELGITAMTIWRWDNDPKIAPEMEALGWPPAMKAGQRKQSRKSRSRQQLEAFKANLMRRAIAERQSRKADLAAPITRRSRQRESLAP
jgi:hypothetical protein